MKNLIIFFAIIFASVLTSCSERKTQHPFIRSIVDQYRPTNGTERCYEWQKLSHHVNKDTLYINYGFASLCGSSPHLTGDVRTIKIGGLDTMNLNLFRIKE